MKIEELRRRLTFLESVVESISIAVIALDERSRIAVFNPVAQKGLLSSQEDAIGSHISRFFPSYSADSWQAGSASFQGEMRARRSDGCEFLVQTSVSQVVAGGEKLSIIVIGELTERKSADATLSNLSQKLIEAQEKERVWIARELHDDISQRLGLLHISLESLKKHLPPSASEAIRTIEEACRSTEELVSDTAALSHRLHSSKLEHLGLTAAVSSYCRGLSERSNVIVNFQATNLPKMPEPIALCLFRVLQEALNNAVRHSGVRHFDVSLIGESNEICLRVHDSGVGFVPERAIRERGLGLASMTERVKLVGGKLNIETKPDGGTTVEVRVTLDSRLYSSKTF
jgi:PAS domain S-box-containing protein